MFYLQRVHNALLSNKKQPAKMRVVFIFVLLCGLTF